MFMIIQIIKWTQQKQNGRKLEGRTTEMTTSSVNGWTFDLEEEEEKWEKTNEYRTLCKQQNVCWYFKNP